MPRTPSSLRVLAFLVITASVAAAQDLPDIPAAARDAYKQGLDAAGRQQYDIALDRFEAALKQAGACLDCMEAIARTEQAMGNDKAALSTAAKMYATASLPKSKARADVLTGRIAYEQYFEYTDGSGGYDKNPGRAQDALRRAEASFARAVQEDPGNEQIMMLHGHLQASLKRDADASATFTACAAVPGASAAECARALRFAKNVDIARNEPAPQFEAKTLDGKKVSLDSLAGKIVLIDFWGTWCPVCRRDSDYVQSLHGSFDTDRFVLLEVDSGDSRAALDSYIRDNDMQGVQIQDENNNLQTLFRVSAFPTYVVLDGDGVVRMRVRGASGDLRGEIRKLLAETHTAENTAPAKP